MNNELSDELVITRLIDRVESGNTFVLQQIGKTIKEIGELKPTQLYQLEQMVKYGARYDTIIERLSKITKLNTKEIDEIFEAYSKRDYKFAEKFYKYRNIPYVPFNEMTALKNEVDALKIMTKGTYMNLAKTSVLGFWLNDRFYNIQEAYRYAVDQAILSISQGKDTFQHQMYSLLKQFGDSGVRTIDYESGTSRRLDSALKMNLRGGIRELHNVTQEVLGKDFGADGVEITVHEYPAPDHENAQGRQFSYDEYRKLQTIGVAKSYTGLTINMHLDLKSVEATRLSFRPISKYNCYHNIFAIVLGVSQPQYTNEKLEQIKERNKKGFDFEGKHYNMYEGTQLMRRIETEIRKQKENQILGKSANNEELIGYSQQKITQLTNKYRDVIKASGLKSQLKRARVPGYRRKKIK